MKHVLYLALISILVTGCADNPLKEASIEDRALTTSSGKTAGAGMVQTSPTNAAGSANTSGMTQTDVSGKPLSTDSARTPTQAQTTSGVKTQGLALQDPESRHLSGADGNSAGTVGAAANASGQAGAATDGSGHDDADRLKFVAQPVLDPRDPKSPLAQRRLMFDYDSSAIRDEYRTLLEMHAQYLKNEKAARMILQGHADERGSREYNIALGQRRAESVFNALNLLGVSNEQMEAVSLGEEKPVSEGHDENAWAQNRRAELLYDSD